jgi:hypothetical protein
MNLHNDFVAAAAAAAAASASASARSVQICRPSDI